MTETCWLKEAITPTNANKGETNFRDAVTKMRKRKDGEDISRNDGEKKRKEKKKDSRNRGGGRGGGEEGRRGGGQSSFSRLSICFQRGQEN